MVYCLNHLSSNLPKLVQLTELEVGFRLKTMEKTLSEIGRSVNYIESNVSELRGRFVPSEFDE